MKQMLFLLILTTISTPLHAVMLDYDVTTAPVITPDLYFTGDVPLAGPSIPPNGTEELWINFLAANGDKQHIAVDSTGFEILGSIS